MLARTHAAIGIFTSFVLLQPKAPREFIVIGTFSLLGSLIPDIDVEGSKINSNAVFSFTIELLYSHELLSFVTGYTMHLFADSLTISGIPLLYPYSNKYYGYRIIRTGSSANKAIGNICIILIISFIFRI